MPQVNASPIYFSPKSLSDSLDATEAFPGAMASLQNLIFDPSTENVLQCRPAAIELLPPRFPNPILSFGFVSVFKVVGDILYGLAASRLNPGNDQPFAVNLPGLMAATADPQRQAAVLAVTGITAANTPASPPSSGPWTPPTMDVIGTKLVVTHPGFGGTATATGAIVFNGGNPSNNDTITLNGTTITFVTGAPAADQVKIGVSLAATLTALEAFLTAPTDANIGQGVYTATATQLNIAYIVSGSSGNAYMLAASAATPSGATLAGGAGGYFGWFDISTPSAPVWNAGNTAVNPLPAAPIAVVQFNDRAYYLVNPPGAQPGLFASDVLDPLTQTDGTFILTFGDNEQLTALAGLPLNNQLGGIIQSVIVFKGVVAMYQVTGDPAANTAAGPWTKNALNVATGTLSPRSVVPTPKGLMFMSPQGLRVISFTAQVSDPIGANGKGISTPFIYAPVPSRIAAAANASLLRISVTDRNSQNREFWLDMTRGVWTGPHTLPATMIAPYQNTFVMAPIALPNSLWQSDWVQAPSSTFTEAGLAMGWTYQTSMLADVKDMQQHEMHKTTLLLSCGSTATIYAVDEQGTLLGAASVAPIGTSSNWNAATWQGSMYFDQAFSLPTVEVAWDQTVVFSRLSLQASGVSDSLTRIGAMSMRYEQLGYPPQPGA